MSKMYNTEKPTKVTIESHGRTFSAELPWDVGITELTLALRGLMISAGWPVELVDEYIKTNED
jgi:hypothetical protein